MLRWVMAGSAAERRRGPHHDAPRTPLRQLMDDRNGYMTARDFYLVFHRIFEGYGVNSVLYKWARNVIPD